ncbi:PfkB family carbohydrate kinase (plasmid) [Neorhizobium galegae]|nr:PfkB family carbohydrate kinase [Neorhizobium galegae]
MITPDTSSNTFKVLGLGDNVVDRYLNTGQMYPGGNALNFAVYAKMLGADAAFLGTFGTDAAARHVRATLEALCVPATHSRIIEGENGHADVRVVDGNREFVFSNKGGVARKARSRQAKATSTTSQPSHWCIRVATVTSTSILRR